MKKIVFIGLAALVLTGCISGSFEYTPPSKLIKIDNSKTVNGNKEFVWKNLISNLGTSFFVINNIDKDSGFINLSYSGSSDRYLDCGMIKSIVNNARGKRVYEFPASVESKRYEIVSRGDIYVVDRRLLLDGRVNIIIQELSINESMITVNARYGLSNDSDVLDITGKKIEHSRDSISFNTNGAMSFKSLDNKGTICISSGLLEREILNLVE